MDIGNDLPLILALIAAFLVAALLGAAEAALLRVPAVRAAALAESGDANAKRLAGLLKRLTRVLNAILLAALLAQIAAATITGVLADRWFGSLGITIASVVLTLLLFVYAEAIPKTYAVRHPTRVALLLSGLIGLLERLFRPLVSLLVGFADLQMPGKGISVSPTVTEEELKMLALRAASEGEITDEDQTLISKAFRFGDRQVDDVMVPRPQMVAVSVDASIAEATLIALEAGHRRLPLYEGSIEHVVGMVRLRDLVKIPEDRRSLEVRRLMSDVLEVPESKAIGDLLRDMQRTSTHLAIAVDEYGGTAGLVTIEDIVEELLGSISDDNDAPPIVESASGVWSVDAALPIEDLSELLERDLGSDGWNTVAGFMMSALGRLPEVGDEIDVDGGTLRVIGTRGRRITRVQVSADDQPSAPSQT
ncbi:MAG: hemolysin family protein [Acidimicrobiia bacterium]|nr:hemolysin family protein [Acidimicrobiia bacterium]MBT8249461.1 hemolysin family protein [Acidimicrobiia bacterium]NNL27633.1 HlyC/CorC family transporter [Acidimicrobiia bacterium]